MALLIFFAFSAPALPIMSALSLQGETAVVVSPVLDALADRHCDCKENDK